TQFGFDALAFGDVAHDAADEGDLAVLIKDGDAAGFDPDGGAVLAQPADIADVGGGFALQAGGDALLAVFGMDDFDAEVGVGVELFGGVAGDLGDGWADVDEAALLRKFVLE